jgi:hypothetical protein
MDPEAVAYVTQHIGGSSKRTAIGESLGVARSGEPDKSPSGRPLIGKIGIGLFAVAQLTQHFQIITKRAGDHYRTSATILLTTYAEERLARPSANPEIFDAGTVKILSVRVPESELNSHGTTIILYDLRPEVKRTLQSYRRWQSILEREEDEKRERSKLEAEVLPYVEPKPKYHVGLAGDVEGELNLRIQPSLPWRDDQTPEQRFRSYFDAAKDISGRERGPANLAHFDNYLRLMWNLSLSIPLPYVGVHPFDTTGASGLIFLEVPPLKKRQAEEFKLKKSERLRDRLGLVSGASDVSLDFGVIFDGVLLKRPIELSGELRAPSRVPAPVLMAGTHKAPFDRHTLERAGGGLEFEAYLYWNSRIVPKETNGVLVRIREASGTLFDQSFLAYQVSEQTRLRQLTAEILVRQGLDTALNIDRESFNFSHPHFLYLQRWLHRAIRLLVNKLKLISQADLEQEKQQRSQTERAQRDQVAFQVWTRRLGPDADPPVARQSSGLPAAVAGEEIDWVSADTGPPITSETDQARSIAIVLAAYGVLAVLGAEDRPPDPGSHGCDALETPCPLLMKMILSETFFRLWSNRRYLCVSTAFNPGISLGSNWCAAISGALSRRD